MKLFASEFSLSSQTTKQANMNIRALTLRLEVHHNIYSFKIINKQGKNKIND